MGALFITVHDQDGDAAESSRRCGEMGELAARYLKLESQDVINMDNNNCDKLC